MKVILATPGVKKKEKKKKKLVLSENKVKRLRGAWLKLETFKDMITLVLTVV